MVVWAWCIGSGVWWATDLAVECPQAELFRTGAQRDLFTAGVEIWVLRGLYPNVCACRCVRVLDGLLRVFAGYVADGSLRDWIDGRRLYAGDPAGALARALDLAVQSAWGLDHAHGRGGGAPGRSSPSAYCSTPPWAGSS
ncbi:hypothetical protein ACWCXX_19755 [Streptomyces sp. NPDC001732]